MMEIVRYLQDNYYSRYMKKNPEIIPSDGILLRALELHPEKVIVMRSNFIIDGVAIYLQLDDFTYDHIEHFDMKDASVLRELLGQKGNNIHFILVAGSGVANILKGIRRIKQLNPRSISWWNPNHTHLHKRILEKESVCHL